ncbi:hypothetical protein [Cupriavidus malaysiensis]|uniref:Uncharacterized protein n=1 Tax=Cupriavidus malaysiensis TaxID=367825 RepID=A0ABM6F3B4_9BURK|nr:hypothetical protein [Cupriavidus malaysiensis]AOZ05905.1 hypothetical protein BKK80_08775 [Cupriavidus malaysiensis]
MTTATPTSPADLKSGINFTFRKLHLTTKSVVRFIAHSGKVFEATSLEEAIELAEDGLGVSLDYGMEEHGRLERVTLVRSRSGKWLEPKVRRERVWPNTPEWQAVRQTLRDVLDAFQNRALVGPCPYDEDGYLPGEREAEAALAC